MNEEFEIYNTEDFSLSSEISEEVSSLQFEPHTIQNYDESFSGSINYGQLTFFGVMIILLFLILTKLGGSK